MNCVADGKTVISPGFIAEARYLNGSVVPWQSNDASYALLTTIDGSFQSYPAYLGVSGRVLPTSVPSLVFGIPQFRSPLDISASPLLNPGGDEFLMGSLNPWVDLPVATIGATLSAGADISTQNQTWSGSPPFVMQAWGSSGLPYGVQDSPVVQLPGFPGSYSYVAFAQGISSLPWTVTTCVDSINTVLAFDAGTLPNLTCPSNVPIYAPTPPFGTYSLVTSYNPRPCPVNNCGWPLQVSHVEE